MTSAELWEWYNSGVIPAESLYWMLEVIRKDDHEFRNKTDTSG